MPDESRAVSPPEAGPRTQEVLARRERAVARGVSQTTRIVPESAEGAQIVDVDGRRFIDFAGGIGSLNMGHRHPRVMERVREQVERLHHVAIGVAIPEVYVEVCERLGEVTPGAFPKKAALFNSGAEAIENAVKIARAYTGRPGIVAFANAYHGRTLLTMTLTAKYNPYKVDFGPFAPEVYRVPYAYCYRCPLSEDPANCPTHKAAELENLLRVEADPSHIAAVVIEPVLGEGGFVVPPPEFLRNVQQVCNRHGILLIADEIQTGFGRCGAMFASQAVGLVPDLVCVGKSLAGGLPLSAVVGRADVMDGPVPGGLGGTYAGNPVACAAAIGVMEAFEEDDLVGQGRRLGAVLKERIGSWLHRYPVIGDVRVMGAMAALELVRDRATKEPDPQATQEVLAYCHARGLLVIKAGVYDNVVRTLMPLNIGDGVLDEGLAILEAAIAHVSLKLTAGTVAGLAE